MSKNEPAKKMKQQQNKLTRLQGKKQLIHGVHAYYEFYSLSLIWYAETKVWIVCNV
jgi:hypothetical protein